MAKPKIVGCPNCGKNAIREGNTVTCESCDAQFEITTKDGAHAVAIGRFDALEARVTKLESPTPESEPNDKTKDQAQDEEEI